MLLVDVSPFRGSPLATPEKLREIVSDMAELGLEIGRLPFEIRPTFNLKPGDAFVGDMMTDVDQEGEEMIPGKITIILSYPWVKVTYDKMGMKVPPIYLCKARVSCIC